MDESALVLPGRDQLNPGAREDFGKESRARGKASAEEVEALHENGRTVERPAALIC